MDTDEIDSAIQDLQTNYAALLAKHTKLRTDYDQLSLKLRTPGTKFLVDLEYRLVLDTTIVAALSTLTTSAVFETLPGALHAVYVLSAYAPLSNVPVLVTDGSITVAPAGAITVGIQRQRQTGPTRIEASLALYNSNAAAHSVAVKVWRRIGMGS